MAAHRFRVLCLARNYPNNAFPRLGLWTERLVESCVGAADLKVIAPVPYWPPVPGPTEYRRFRQVTSRERRRGVDVFHPRFLTGPGQVFHSVEGWPYYASVVRCADTLRRSFPFELIHAHFIYPDGWVAAKMARRYGIPFIITEHAAWRPWLNAHPSVRRRALWAAEASTWFVSSIAAMPDAIAGWLTLKGPRMRLIASTMCAGP